MVVTFDGPSAFGNGTLAARIAQRLRVPYPDTGLLCRAVARDVGLRVDDAQAAGSAASRLDFATLGDAALRGPAMGEAASIATAIPEVRAALFARLVAFAEDTRGAVLDGGIAAPSRVPTST